MKKKKRLAPQHSRLKVDCGAAVKSRRTEQPSVCLLCSDKGSFEYTVNTSAFPGWKELVGGDVLAIPATAKYECPFCAESKEAKSTTHRGLTEGHTAILPVKRERVNDLERLEVSQGVSEWLLSALVNRGVQPEIACEVARSKGLSVTDAIRLADEKMAEWIDRLTCNYIQNLSREQMDTGSVSLAEEPSDDCAVKDFFGQFGLVSIPMASSDLRKLASLGKRMMKWYDMYADRYLQRFVSLMNFVWNALKSSQLTQDVQTNIISKWIQSEFELLKEGLFLFDPTNPILSIPRILLVPRPQISDISGELENILKESAGLKDDVAEFVLRRFRDLFVVRNEKNEPPELISASFPNKDEDEDDGNAELIVEVDVTYSPAAAAAEAVLDIE